MKAVLVQVPDSMLEDRRRKGLDKFDEMWEGVLHLVQPPSGQHQRLAAEVLAILLPMAKARGLSCSHETGLYNDPGDYRVPDLVIARGEHMTDAGVSGAVLVIEHRSPGDETYEKLDWYVARGVDEILVIDPETRLVELYRGVDGHAVPIEPYAAGRVALECLEGLSLGPVDTAAGPRLRVEWPGGSAEL